MNFRKLFDDDSPLGRFLGRTIDLCVLNLLWLLLCLPVVTAGAATCALHWAIIQMRQDRPGLYRGFFHAFRRDFWQATALWLMLLAAGAGLVLSFMLLAGWEGAAAMAGRVILCAPMALLALVAVYGFPLLARFQLPFGAILSDTVLLGLAYFPTTLLIVGLNLLPVLLVYFLPSVFASLLFIWVPLGFSLTALLIEKCLEPVMSRISEDNSSPHR